MRQRGSPVRVEGRLHHRRRAGSGKLSRSHEMGGHLRRRGRSKNLKIYRLYQKEKKDAADDDDEEIFPAQVFTRCKGISRSTGSKLPDRDFDASDVCRTVVHRTTLRPSRAGEIFMCHETKSLAAPFNFKRRVARDGIHTFGFTAADASADRSSSPSSGSDF